MLPSVRGLPWWGATLAATALTAIGAGIDAGLHGSLGIFYQVLYLVGCVGAALAVRRRALFTAAVQPPLIAFMVSIVVLYLLSPNIQLSAKNLIFKLALPIASSFPSMAVTFVLTLAVVVARWYISRPAKTAAPVRAPAARPAAAAARTGRRAAPTRTDQPAAAAPRSTGHRRAAATTDEDRRAQPGRRRDDTASSARPRRRPDGVEQVRQRPRPPAPAQQNARPAPAQQAPVRRTAGAAARAAGVVDLTADLPDQAVRRRPPSAG